MKKVLLFAVIIIVANYSLVAQISVSSNGNNPDPSAMLDVQSTLTGFLPPRMTEAQMNSISNPAIGLMVLCTDCTPRKPMFFSGYYWVNFTGTPDLASDEVFNPITGKIWKDRNIGASQVATSGSDVAAYGDLYQWGRATEGHESRSSGTTSTLAITAVPNGGNSWDGLFITIASYPGDWLDIVDDFLWQPVSGTNTPCPADFRLPVSSEWEAERQSWSSNNAAGAFNSPLKLVNGGLRYGSDGTINSTGTAGYYWTSTILGAKARHLLFDSSASLPGGGAYRSYGFSVRCIKD